ALHSGYAKVNSVDEEKGLVVLDLMEACSGCPHSVYTLALGIKKILEKSLPWVKEVKSSEEPKEPDFGFYLAPKPSG
ncbi:MAG: NifU family protein, partial [bacterium]|nr:NifU family protein [bacterium]